MSVSPCSAKTVYGGDGDGDGDWIGGDGVAMVNEEGPYCQDRAIPTLYADRG